MRVSKLSAAITGLTLVLTGCGGGGSTGPSTPTAATPTTPTVPPLSSALPVQAAELQPAVAAKYTEGTSEYLSFAKLNAFRASQGLGPLNHSVLIDDAARKHAAYVAMNQSGADPHSEIVGKPGFTGATVTDRVKAAGYQATTATEVIAFSLQFPNPDTSAIDNLINGIYHRNAMMYQGMTDVGFSGENANNPLYGNIAAIKRQVNAGDYFGVFPANNQTGVWLTHSLESPNPFYQEMEMSQANMCTKTSSPISVASEASTTLSVTTFTVAEEGSDTAMDARLITKETSDQDKIYLPSNVAFLIGKTPFKANTKYIVRFVGKANGTATGTTGGLSIEKTWSFTTGSFKRGC